MAGAVVGLAAAIEGLRAELTEAMRRGWGQGMQFQVEPVELTVQAVVTTEANGKIGWKIFELGGSYESEATQTVTLRLAPVWKNPDGTVVRDFSIAAVRPAGDLFGPHE